MASSAVLSLYQTFEQLMVSIGLGSPVARAAVGAAFGGIPILLHFPISYKQVSEGVYLPRSWSLTNPSDENSTAFPWFIFPILGAVFFSLFL